MIFKKNDNWSGESLLSLNCENICFLCIEVVFWSVYSNMMIYIGYLNCLSNFTRKLYNRICWNTKKHLTSSFYTDTFFTQSIATLKYALFDSKQVRWLKLISNWLTTGWWPKAYISDSSFLVLTESYRSSFNVFTSLVDSNLRVICDRQGGGCRQSTRNPIWNLSARCTCTLGRTDSRKHQL